MSSPWLAASLSMIVFLGFYGEVSAEPSHFMAAETRSSMAGGSGHNPIPHLGKMPLVFIDNKGQVHEQVKFYVRAGGQTLWLTEAGIIFDLLRSNGQRDQEQSGTTAHASAPMSRLSKSQAVTQERLVFTQSFMRAQPGMWIEAQHPRPGRYNYFLGNDPTLWRHGVRAYAEVIYRQVWEGIDVKLYGNGRDLEQEFVVHPGGDLRQIRMAYHGIKGLDIAPNGSLVIHTAFGELRERPPRIYQEVDGQRVEVEGRFKLLSNTAYTFEVAPYSSQYALIIDPPLLYSTYLGGNDLDTGFDIAVDAAGNAYVTGETLSTDFPTVAPFQAAPAEARLSAFVTKLNATGSALVYSTYLGGRGAAGDSGRSIAVDGAGNAYVAGETSSPDFPVNAGAFQTTKHDFSDAFVAKLNATGSVLLYATYLGGNSLENVSLGSGGIAVDAAGNAYVTGETLSADFPTVDAVQPVFGGGETDAFVTKLNTTGSEFVYSTYLGGSNDDTGYDVAVDAAANAYVTGETFSANFPVRMPALQPQRDMHAARHALQIAPATAYRPPLRSARPS
jgi:hypothetical protein